MDSYPYDSSETFLKHVEFAAQFGPLRELSLKSTTMAWHKYYNIDIWAILVVTFVIGLVLLYKLATQIITHVLPKTKME